MQFSVCACCFSGLMLARTSIRPGYCLYLGFAIIFVYIKFHVNFCPCNVFFGLDTGLSKSKKKSGDTFYACRWQYTNITDLFVRHVLKSSPLVGCYHCNHENNEYIFSRYSFWRANLTKPKLPHRLGDSHPGLRPSDSPVPLTSCQKILRDAAFLQAQRGDCVRWLQQDRGAHPGYLQDGVPHEVPMGQQRRYCVRPRQTFQVRTGSVRHVG